MAFRFEGSGLRTDGPFAGHATLARPLATPAGDAPHGPWTVIAGEPEIATAAIDRGARGVLLALSDDLEAAGRMAAALSVAEAERGLEQCDIALLAMIAGPGAALALARRPVLPRRLAALGLDLAAFASPAGADARLAAGLVTLTAAALGLPSFVAGAPASGPDATDIADFACRLIETTGASRGKSGPMA